MGLAFLISFYVTRYFPEDVLDQDSRFFPLIRIITSPSKPLSKSPVKSFYNLYEREKRSSEK